jgi:NIMA (never in mitosis gene a)-related kinase 2
MAQHDFASTYVGTPFYMSPEICSAERYTLKSDIWSLGCIIYELCAREPPFNAKTHLELIQKIKAGRVSRIPSHYTPELWNMISCCLQVNARNRPDTASLLNLPIVKLMRKEQEVVSLGQQMKFEKERAQQAVKALNDKMASFEHEKAALRAEINETLQREWEIKARVEIDRQVQIESERLKSLFEAEVIKRVTSEVEKRLAAMPVRSSTPTLDHPDEAANNGKSTSTYTTASDFPSQTDLSSLSLDSPTENTTFKPQKRPTRTPFQRAKTMSFEPGQSVASPMDVPMLDATPGSIAPLQLSPRRLQRGNNIFAQTNLNKREPTAFPQIPETQSEGEEGDCEREDDVPALPSPTRPRSALMNEDPFKVLAQKPSLKPTAPRLASAPNLFANGAQTRPARAVQSTVPVVATSPNRRKPKSTNSNESGSPVRKIAINNNAAANGGLRSKKDLPDVRKDVVKRSHNVQGRTLIELAQARGIPSGAAISSAPVSASESEDSSIAENKKAGRRTEIDHEVPQWDPDTDDMPSPFLVRGPRSGGRAYGLR